MKIYGVKNSSANSSAKELQRWRLPSPCSILTSTTYHRSPLTTQITNPFKASCQPARHFTLNHQQQYLRSMQARTNRGIINPIFNPHQHQHHPQASITPNAHSQAKREDEWEWGMLIIHASFSHHHQSHHRLPIQSKRSAAQPQASVESEVGKKRGERNKSRMSSRSVPKEQALHSLHPVKSAKAKPSAPQRSQRA